MTNPQVPSPASALRAEPTRGYRDYIQRGMTLCGRIASGKYGDPEVLDCYNVQNWPNWKEAPTLAESEVEYALRNPSPRGLSWGSKIRFG